MVISLLPSIVLLLSLITSHNILANSVHKTNTKHSIIPTIKPNLDALTNSSRYDYNLCKNQSESNNDNGKTTPCLFNIESILKASKTKLQSLVIKKLTQKNLQTTKTWPMWGGMHGPLLYSLESSW